MAGDSVPVTVTSGDSTAPGAGPIPFVETLVGAMGQFNIAFPIAFELTKAIIKLFRDRNPSEPLPTDAEIIAALKARALADKDANEQWLRDRGFI